MALSEREFVRRGVEGTLTKEDLAGIANPDFNTARQQLFDKIAPDADPNASIESVLEQRSVSSMLEELPAARSKEYNELKAVEAAVLNISAGATDALGAFDAAVRSIESSPNIPQTLESLRQDAANAAKQDLVQGATELANADPNQIPRAANMINAVDRLNARYSGELGTENLLQDTFGDPAVIDITSVQARNDAAMGVYFSRYADWAEERNVFNKVVDGVSLLVPDNIKDANDLVQEGFIDSIGDLKSLINGFQQADPEVKVQAFDELFPRLVDAYDNNEYKIGAMLALLFDPDFDRVISSAAAIDAFDLGTIALPISFSLFRGVTRGLKLQRKLRDMGALDEAALLNQISEAKGPFVGPTKANDPNVQGPQIPTRTSDEFEFTGFEDLPPAETAAVSKVTEEVTEGGGFEFKGFEGDGKQQVLDTSASTPITPTKVEIQSAKPTQAAGELAVEKAPRGKKPKRYEGDIEITNTGPGDYFAETPEGKILSITKTTGEGAGWHVFPEGGGRMEWIGDNFTTAMVNIRSRLNRPERTGTAAAPETPTIPKSGPLKLNISTDTGETLEVSVLLHKFKGEGWGYVSQTDNISIGDSSLRFKTRKEAAVEAIFAAKQGDITRFSGDLVPLQGPPRPKGIDQRTTKVTETRTAPKQYDLKTSAATFRVDGSSGEWKLFDSKGEWIQTFSTRKAAVAHVESQTVPLGPPKPKGINQRTPSALNDRVTSAQNADATNWERVPLGIGATDRLTAQITRLKEEIQRSVDAPVDVLTPDEILTVDPFTAGEKETRINNFVDALYEKAKEKGQYIEWSQPIQHNKDGFTVAYKFDGEDVVEHIKWKEDDAGTLVGENVTLRGKLRNHPAVAKIFSPGFLLGTISGIVKETTRAGLQAARLQDSLAGVGRAIQKKYKKQKVSINELLMAGDEFVHPVSKAQGKLFTRAELEEGVETASGLRRYTPEEIEGYFAMRKYFDLLWSYRNFMIRQHLDFKGAKNLDIGLADGTVSKEIIVPSSWDELKDGKGINAWHPQDDVDSFELLGASPERIEVLKNEGWELHRLLETKRRQNPVTGEFEDVRHVLVHQSGATKIKQLPDEVLNYQPGYVPRIRQPGMFYVKDVNSEKTVRTFLGRNEARRWIDEQHRLQSETPDVPADQQVKLEMVRDGGLTPTEAERRAKSVLTVEDMLIEDGRQYGGLYNSARANEPLLMGEDGVTPFRLGVDQSIERYINNISSTMPYDEYRLALVQKFKNQVRAEGSFETRDWKTSKIFHPDPRTADLLTQTRDYMLDALKMQSREERTWTRVMHTAADIMEGRLGQGTKEIAARKWATSLGERSPLQELKKLAFHSHLGTFNLRQLYVQSQNAALAASIAPREAPQAFKASTIMNLTILSSKKSVHALAAARAGEDVADHVANVQQYLSSGLRDSIYHNADTGIVAEGLGGGTLQGLRKTLKAGTIFFREGENFARLLSWNIARQRFLKETGKQGKDLNAEDVSSIVDEALRMNMNMQKENAAPWQTNALTGNATQFMQVQAKLMERMLGGLFSGGVKGRTLGEARQVSGWTRGEAGRVLGGQLFLYGTAGVPIASSMVNYAAELAGVTPQEFRAQNPNAHEQINDGFMGVVAAMMGADNRVGESGSILAGADDNVVWKLAEGFIDTAQGNRDVQSAWDIAGGASLGVLKRSVNAVDALGQSMWDLFHVRDITDVPTEVLLPVLNEVGSITSFWSNARKVTEVAAFKQGLRSKRGALIASTSDLQEQGQLDMADLFARALGLPFDYEAEYYAGSAALRDDRQDLMNTKQDIKGAMIRAINTGNFARLEAEVALLTTRYSQPQIKTMMDSMIKDFASGKSSADKQRAQMISSWLKSGGRFSFSFENAPKQEQ